MASFLGRLLGGRARREEEFRPARLGPDCRLPGPDRVEITSGPLAGTALHLRFEIGPRKADFYLEDASGAPDPVAHTHFDRDPDAALETEWDIFVRPDYRGKGLTGLIVRLSYRRLLAIGGRRWFAMRKLMQVDSRRRELQNIGIGVIGIRIGMRPEPGLEEMLSPAGVKSIELIETGTPGLFIELRRLPGVVVAAELDAAGRPHLDVEHYRRLVNPAEIARAARAGRAVVGNIDYLLPVEHIGLFSRHFADNDGEYRNWCRALRSGARRNN